MHNLQKCAVLCQVSRYSKKYLKLKKYLYHAHYIDMNNTHQTDHAFCSSLVFNFKGEIFISHFLAQFFAVEDLETFKSEMENDLFSSSPMKKHKETPFTYWMLAFSSTNMENFQPHPI